jgi:hypothetical protein
MGHTVWVDVRDRSNAESLQDNSIMLRLQKELDELALRLNVPKLSEFYDYSELMAHYGELEDDGDEPADADSSVGNVQAEAVWFDPGPALGAVRAIEGHLNLHPNDLGFESTPSKAHWPASLMKELMHCRSVLEDALSRGQHIRFLIVP